MDRHNRENWARWPSQPGKFLPVLVVLATWTGVAYAEPAPPRVGANGRAITREGKSIQVIAPDEKSSGEKVKGFKPLPQPPSIRGFESFRTVREFLPTGTLVFHNGREIGLLGLVFEPTAELVQSRAYLRWSRDLSGKTVRLVFDEATHDSRGDRMAYVFLGDGRLLNEVFLAESLARVDTKQSLSPEYALRFQRAEASSVRKRAESEQRVGWNAGLQPQDTELPERPRGFLGVSAGTATLDRWKRGGENQSP